MLLVDLCLGFAQLLSAGPWRTKNLHRERGSAKAKATSAEIKKAQRDFALAKTSHAPDLRVFGSLMKCLPTSKEQRFRHKSWSLIEVGQAGEPR